MRKWLTAILIVLLLVTTMITPAAALDEPYWHAVDTVTGFIPGAPADDPSTLMWNGTYTADFHYYHPVFQGKRVCTGWGCPQRDIYLEILVKLSFFDQYGKAPYSLDITYGGTVQHSLSIPCTTGGSCFVHKFLTIPAEEISADPAAYGHAGVSMGINGQIGGTQTWVIKVVMSDGPINTDACDKFYQPIMTVDANTIPPTSEAGIGTDSLVAGKKYRLTVMGGPWNDGDGTPDSNHRYDTAVRQGEAAWQSVDEMAGMDNIICQQADPDQPFKIDFVFTSLDASFHIRLNDLPGQFGNNTYGQSVMTYTIQEVALGSGSDCSGQYLEGQLIGQTTVAATNSTGVNLKTVLGSHYPNPPEWVVFKVVSGTWKNNGTGDDLKTLGIRNEAWNGFFSLEAKAGCSISTTDTYYFQFVDKGTYYLRVDDYDSNFASNTGSLSVNIYSVTSYNPYKSGCELQFKLGEQLEDRTVQANLQNGLPINQSSTWDPLGGEQFDVPIRYYMIESYGGPADLGGGVSSYDMEIGQTSIEGALPSEWHYASAVAPFVECFSIIDEAGHFRMFVPWDRQTGLYDFVQNYYGIRVRDTGGNWKDNTGGISYRVFEATKMKLSDTTSATANGCVQFSHDSTSLGTQIIYGDSAVGVRLPAMVGSTSPTAPSVYAIETTNGPWKDNGTSHYDVQISDDGGANWTPILDYPNLLCAQSSDGNHVIVYVQGAAGKTWKIRVNDHDSNFQNNTLSISVTVWPGTNTIDGFPKCDDTYNLTEDTSVSDIGREVPGNLQNGVYVPNMTQGLTYAIEITDKSMWYDDGGPNGSYLVQISDDGGNTWTDINKYTTLCTMMTGNNGRFKIFFVAASNQYRLRVRDTGGNFPPNTGYVIYRLWVAQNKTNPGSSSGSIIPAPPEWQIICEQAFSRPDSLIGWVTTSLHTNGLLSGGVLGDQIDIPIPYPRVGEWLEYGKNSIIYFFLWCPNDTQQLLSIKDMFDGKEPLASIISMFDMAKAVKTTFQSSFAMGGETDGLSVMDPVYFTDTNTIGPGGGNSSSTVSVPSDPLTMLTNGFDKNNNFLFSGRIDLVSGFHSKVIPADYLLACEDRYGSYLGNLTNAYCNSLGLIRTTDLVTLALIVMDLMILVWFAVKYFPHWLTRMFELIQQLLSGVVKVATKLI